VDEGRVNALAPGADMVFSARDLVFYYVEGSQDSPVEIQEFHGIGSPGRVAWADGLIMANAFVACFSPTGPWLEQIVTGPDAEFTLATQDGHELRGRSGALTLDCFIGQPVQISSPAPVSMEGKLDTGEPFFLHGGQSLMSYFSDGRVANTVISGEPVFSFRNQSGRAGSIRLLHSEGRILLSQGAHLQDEEEQIMIQGEEILLANWDQDVHEIFAREFVRLDFQNVDGTPLSGQGDQLNLKMPERILKLKGTAHSHYGSNWVEAQDVLVVPETGVSMALTAESHVKFSALLNGQSCVVEGNKLEMSQETGVIRLFQVQAAQVPDLGELTAEQLVLEAQMDASGWKLSSLNASGQVIFEGIMDPQGEAQAFSCQADELSYFPQTQDLRLTGIDRDVIVLFGSGSEHRSRQLTFNLGDGRMHADSGKHGFPKTFLNIKDKPSEKPVPK